MDCPVCKTTGIKNGTTTCPKCHSDIEVFELINKINGDRQGSSIWSWILGVFLVLALTGWALTYYYYDNAEKNKNVIVDEQINKQLIQIQKLKSNNDALLLTILEQKKQIEGTTTPVSSSATKDVPEKKQAKNEPLTVSQTTQLIKGEKPGLYYYKIAKGESLQIIAEKIYGDKSQYTKIMKDNNIVNPDQVEVGKKLKIYK